MVYIHLSNNQNPIKNMSFLVVSLIVMVLAMGLDQINSSITTLSIITTPNTTKPGCPRKCGNVTIPYPFGVGMGSGCSMGEFYDIVCMEWSSNSNSTKAFLPSATMNQTYTMVEIVDISDTRIRVKTQVAYLCFNDTDSFLSVTNRAYFSLFVGSPYSVSSDLNKLTVVGCHDTSSFDGNVGSNTDLFSPDGGGKCRSNCSSGPESVVPGKCDGVGCCQTPIQKGLTSYSINFDTFDSNHTDVASYNPCGYSFLAEQTRFSFRGVPDLNDPGFIRRVMDEVPVVLDWVVAAGGTCTEARNNAESYACKGNTTCVDATETGIGGYRCSCLPGYQGNPYLAPGCSDINECENSNDTPCSMACTNTPGNYTCFCPSGHSGDGRKDGTGCNPQFPVKQVALGVSFGTFFLLIGVIWTFMAIRKRQIMKKKEKFFQLNGGLLLKQLISPNHQDNVDFVKVFTVEDLKVATKNFAEDRIVGKGGYGTVYKGILPNSQIVAIKKSKFVDESQIEQFINELVLLARTSHPNVVRLLGCCLEVEVPLLVYEFVSNGTLYDHIHDRNGVSWYSWSSCLRIALESANAIAYLHSIPIIHRDIKSTNILLDESYTAKVSDFGASRLIPLNQTHLSTVVQGTLGYLDPEYFSSSQLTEKSDVFSFGVVLTELLTRKGPLLPESQKESNNYNLATYFVKSMREDNLLGLLDSKLVKEVPLKELISVAKLVGKCLNVSGEKRPTMKEVATELQEVIKHLK